MQFVLIMIPPLVKEKTGDDEAELTGYFHKLSAGGQVTQPLEKVPWGDSFGMCTDKFGIAWFVNITAQKA